MVRESWEALACWSISSSIVCKKMSKRTHDGQKKGSTSIFKVPSQIRTRSFRKKSAHCLRKSVLKTTKAQSVSASKVKKNQPSKPSPKPVIKTRRKSTVPRKNTVESEKNESTQKNETTSLSTQTPLNKPESPQRTTLKQRCLESRSGCSFSELIHIRELGEELTDEDLLEIVHCPSPVWWEDPPDESYDEDPIFGQVSHVATSSTEQNTGTKQSPPASETMELKIHRIPDSKCDQNFLTKRSTLESVLQNVISKKVSSKAFINADDGSTAQQLRMFRKTKHFNATINDNNQITEHIETKSHSKESTLKSNQCISNHAKTVFAESKTILNPVIQNDHPNSENVIKSSGHLETEEVISLDFCGTKEIAPFTSIKHQTLYEKSASLILNDSSTTLKKILTTEEPETVSTSIDKSSSSDLKSNTPTKKVYSGSDSAEIIPNDINSNSTKSPKKSEVNENEVIDLCEELENDKNLVEDDLLVFEGKEHEILKDFESLKVPIADINDELIVIEESENEYENFPGQHKCHMQTDNVSNITQNQHSGEQENREQNDEKISDSVINITHEKTDNMIDHQYTNNCLLQDIEGEVIIQTHNTAMKGLKRKRSNSNSSDIICRDDRSTKEDIEESEESSDSLEKIPNYVNESTLAKEKNAEKIRSAYNEMLTKIRSRIKNRKDAHSQKESNTNKKKIIVKLNNSNRISATEMKLKIIGNPKESLLKSIDIDTPDKTYSTAERSVLKVSPIETSTSDKPIIKLDKSKDNSVQNFLKLRAIEAAAKTHYKMENPIIKVFSGQSLTPHMQLKKTLLTNDISGKSFVKSRVITIPAKKPSTAEKSIIKVLPTQMSREMIDEIIGIKNTEVHKKSEPLEDLLCPDLAVKKDIIIEHKDNVKYCFKCSSIYNTTECSYCVEPKQTVEDKIVMQKLYSCDRTIEKSTLDTKTANHVQEN